MVQFVTSLLAIT